MTRGPRLGDQWVAWIKLTNALGRRNPGAGLWPLRTRLGACLMRPL